MADFKSVLGFGARASINISAGTTSNNLSNVTFSNSNNVSFGLNASVITATVTIASSQGNINISAGTTSSFNSAFTFSNSNNVSFGMNGATITATATVASSQGSINISAGATSNLLSAFTFSNASGVSFGLNASTITASVKTDYLTAQTTQSAIKGFGATNTGNTLGNTGISTGIDWVIAGTNNVTVSESTVVGGPNTLWLSAPNIGAGNITFSAGTSSGGIGSVVFSDSNGVSWGLSGSTITATVKTNYLTTETLSQSFGASNLGNTLGTSGIASGGQVRAIVVGGDNVTISQSVNGASVTQSIRAGGTHSLYPIRTAVGAPGVLGNSSLLIAPFMIHGNEIVSFSRIIHPISVSHSSSGDTRTLRLTLGLSIGIYTRNVSTLSVASSTTGNWNITISSQDSTGSFSGLRYLTVNLNASLTPGDYWLGFVSSTDSARQAGGGNAMTFSNMIENVTHGQGAAVTQGLFSAALANTFQFDLGRGAYATSTNVLPNAIQFNEIIATGIPGARQPLIYAANFTQ